VRRPLNEKSSVKKYYAIIIINKIY